MGHTPEARAYRVRALPGASFPLQENSLVRHEQRILQQALIERCRAILARLVNPDHPHVRRQLEGLELTTPARQPVAMRGADDCLIGRPQVQHGPSHLDVASLYPYGTGANGTGGHRFGAAATERLNGSQRLRSR